jgi:hypothetical protein
MSQHAAHLSSPRPGEVTCTPALSTIRMPVVMGLVAGKHQVRQAGQSTRSSGDGPRTTQGMSGTLGSIGGD